MVIYSHNLYFLSGFAIDPSIDAHTKGDKLVGRCDSLSYFNIVIQFRPELF